MRKTRIWMTMAAAALLAAVMLSGTPAPAAFIFITDQSDYQALPLATVTVDVYLREVGTTVIADEGGLLGADVAVSRLDGDAVIVDVLGNADFDFNTTYTPAIPLPPAGVTEAGLAMSSFFNTPGDDGNDVFLATFTILAPGEVGNVSTFSVADFGSETVNNTLTSQGTILDLLIDSGTFTVTVIPEPAAAMMLASLGVMLLSGRFGRARRRGRSPF